MKTFPQKNLKKKTNKYIQQLDLQFLTKIFVFSVNVPLYPVAVTVKSFPHAICLTLGSSNV